MVERRVNSSGTKAREGIIQPYIHGDVFPGKKKSSGARDQLDREQYVWISNLIQDHGNGLLGVFARKIGGDYQKAEDVLQEVWVRAWKNKHRVPKDSKEMRSWLYTVGNRLIIDAHRTAQTRPKEVFDEEQRDDPDKKVEVSEQVVKKLILEEALARLSSNQRETLFEGCFNGLTQTEIAAKLGIPLGTVKSRMYYAVKAMKDIFEEEGITAATFSE